MEKNGRHNFFQHTGPQDLDASAVIEALERILQRLDLIDKHNEDRDEKIKELFNAFPANDPVGHCKYHELQMEMLAERRKLRAAVQEKTISALIWVGIVAVGTAVWHELLSIIKSNVAK